MFKRHSTRGLCRRHV